MVTKTETRTIEELKARWYCDICGKEMTMGCSKHTCDICGCDVCSGCAHEVDGYRHYCPNCWKIGEEYRIRCIAESERHYRTMDAIISDWKRAAGVKE
jgi:hypothetical protein